MAESSSVVGRAFIGAITIFLLVFFLFFAGFFGNLGPIAAIIYGPIAFVVSFIVFWIVESLLEPYTESARKLTYLVLSVILLSPIVIYIGFNYQELARAERMKHPAPLTDEESLLLKSTRLDLRIGVDGGTFPPVYLRHLIRDLQETCLFLRAGEINALKNADVVATITGVYWDGKAGARFVFHLPEHRTEGVEIEVVYKPTGVLTTFSQRLFGISGERDRYVDRLAVQLIKASQTFSGLSQSIITGSLNAEPDERLGCRKK